MTLHSKVVAEMIKTKKMLLLVRYEEGLCRLPKDKSLGVLPLDTIRGGERSLVLLRLSICLIWRYIAIGN